MAIQYNDYLQKVSQSLVREKFETATDLQLGGYKVDLFGWKAVSTLALFYRASCFIRFSENSSIEEITTYSKAAFDYGIEYKPVMKTYPLVFPVLASNRFADDAKSFIAGFEGKTGGWLKGDRIEHPVLIELEVGKMYHYEKPTFFANRPIDVATDFARKHFSP